LIYKEPVPCPDRLEPFSELHIQGNDFDDGRVDIVGVKRLGDSESQIVGLFRSNPFGNSARISS
jgi:hypothetical protein